MLVALATFGLVLVMLFGGVRFAGRSVAAEQRLVAAAEIEPVRSFLRQALSEGEAFEGSAEALQFVGTLPLAWGRPGRFDLRLSVADGRLMLGWSPHSPTGREMPAGQAGQAELLAGIEGFALRYFAADGDVAVAWREATTGRWTPPALIEVAYTPAGRGRSTFYAAPGVDSPRLVAARPAP